MSGSDSSDRDNGITKERTNELACTPLSTFEQSCLEQSFELLSYPALVIDVKTLEIITANQSAISKFSELTEDMIHLIREVVKTKTPVSIESLRGIPIFNKNGEVTHVVEFLSDISEQEDTEKNIKRIITDLATNALNAISEVELFGEGKKILIVEHDEFIRDLLYRLIKKYGFDITMAASAKVAKRLFESEEGEFDIILSDMALPDKDVTGCDLALELKQQNPTLKVILTSGYVDVVDEWPEILKSEFPFLNKPFKIDELIELIRKSLNIACVEKS